jgi:hypothetical protein
MPDLDDLIDHNLFAREYLQVVRRKWSRVSRILIVVDGAIAITPGGDGFGISKMVAELRSFSAGFARLEVTLASRNGPPGHNPAPLPHEFRYTGFRFDQGGPDQVLNHYDQLWCFGHQPTNVGADNVENNPDSLDPALNAIITNAVFNPTSDSELAALTRWMNGPGMGGVFATGDHHLLGASMCFAIPRVSTMRRWRIGERVPTLSLETRFDSVQPSTPGQWSGTEPIPRDAEEDATPQPVHWVPQYHGNGWLLPMKMPHPILCHPTLGPIDVLPDHPHEGFCYDPEAPGWLASQGEAVYTFGSLHGKHYPEVNGIRPLPKVIAWGQTLASPPLRFHKGAQPQRTVPLIVVYDGQQAGLGRVVVDSTWHHWFDMNLRGLEAAVDPRAYRKIARYHVNVAIWLASPAWRAAMTMAGLKAAQFDYFGLEDAELQSDPAQLGMSVLKFLAPTVGACWVLDLADAAIAAVHRDLPSPPKPDGRPCLTRPPEDYVYAVVLGEIVKDLYSDLGYALRELAQKGRIEAPRHLPGEPFDIAVAAAHRALAHIAGVWRQDIAESKKHLDTLSRSIKAFGPPHPA